MKTNEGWYVTEFWDPQGANLKDGTRGCLVFHQHFIDRRANGVDAAIDYIQEVLNDELLTLGENQGIIRVKKGYAVSKACSPKVIREMNRATSSALSKSTERINSLQNSIKQWEFFRTGNSHFHPQNINEALVEETHYNPLKLEATGTMAVIGHAITADVAKDLVIKVNSNAWDIFTHQIGDIAKIRQESPDVKYFGLTLSPWYGAQVPREFIDLLIAHPWEEKYGAQMKAFRRKDHQKRAELIGDPHIGFYS